MLTDLRDQLDNYGIDTALAYYQRKAGDLRALESHDARFREVREELSPSLVAPSCLYFGAARRALARRRTPPTPCFLLIFLASYQSAAGRVLPRGARGPILMPSLSAL